MKNTLILFSLLSIFISCGKGTSFYPNIVSQQNIQIDSIEFEEVELNLNDYECSYYGYSYIRDSNLYFVDKYLCWLFIFNSKGQVIQRELGQGRGPNEVVTTNISSIASCQNGDLMVLGYTLDHYFFNKDFKRINTYMLQENNKTEIHENSDTYTTFYPNLVIKNFGDKLYYNLYSEAENFNFVYTPEKYYPKAYTLMQTNRDSGRVEKLLCPYPPFYQEHIGELDAMISLNYDFDSEGNLYVGFEADSTIYKYKQDEYPIKAFGYKGKNMNQNYQAIRSWEECSKMVSEDRTNKGYYTSLYVSPTDNYIFRTYQKGSHDSTDGLQIYQNEVLIGDVPAPKGIKIIGYIAPYYYSEIMTDIDIDNDKMYIYRFKL